MQTRFLLGPAGSGKTFRCLAEIRAALETAAEGPPLLLIAPKQTTYQLERQLLSQPGLSGYTRLHILSFERLASFLFDRLQKPSPRLLSDEGRVMVLRALLAKKRDTLKLFRASARLTGFAQHLSQALRELQRQGLAPESLLDLAERTRGIGGLSLKLQDLAALLRDYLDWLRGRDLQDAERLLPDAVEMLRGPHPPLAFGGIWVDGFTEFSPQELDLLAELLPCAEAATITFCLDRVPAEKISWLSNWSAVESAYHRCHARLSELPGCRLSDELLSRDAGQGRFARNPVLAHLEASWANPREAETPADQIKEALRIADCANPEAEATLAAREILRFVREKGGRFREVTVLARSLLPYHEIVANVFNRYEIPFFLDRRESVSHHPLAELTRNALRTVAYSWAHADWFAALKTGLMPAGEGDIDRLENEALARGWKGKAWQQPLFIQESPELGQALEKLRLNILPPFNKLALQFARQSNRPTGAQLAEALREFWSALNVAETLQAWSADETDPRAIHRTVWDQMSTWLEDLELAFPTESLTLREWLPILDAGLASLTVGVIPPALDQVFIGAIDRSRNPDIRLAIVLGLNEAVFPAPPAISVLLTEADRLALEKEGIPVASARQRLGQERFFAYVAFTRARERLVLAFSETDSDGKKLNPSPFLAQVQRLFGGLKSEKFPRTLDWKESEHASELIVPLLQNQIQPPAGQNADLSRLKKLPELAPVLDRLRHLVAVSEAASLSPALAARLYGSELRSSVSRMEQFAACPFKFFVHSGLRAEERELFEMDVRDQGNFQHQVLELFHHQLTKEGKRWRDVTPSEARERIKAIAAAHAVVFRDGLLQATEKGKFTARVLAEALQDFVETLIDWMRRQYAFDPAQVELAFGDDGNAPWQLELGKGLRLLLKGRIDRVDLHVDRANDRALCVVMDYKSSQKKLDAVLMEHGLQLQLAAYLDVLRRWPDPRARFGVSRLIPAGVFYVNLRGRYESGDSRTEALADIPAERRQAYRHAGRFDAEALPQLDRRPDATRGDQFNYSRKKDGSLSANSSEALPKTEFAALLDHVETVLKQMGQGIYAGVVSVDPYQKGNLTACDHCAYRPVCRIDPWTHTWRVLKKSAREEGP